MASGMGIECSWVDVAELLSNGGMKLRLRNRSNDLVAVRPQP